MTKVEKDRIIAVRRKTEHWYADDIKKSAIELAVCTHGSVMQFEMSDSRLPPDLESQWERYLLCYERFGKGQPSNTGITSVWFEKNG